MLIAWSSGLSVGVLSIDTEHKRLVQMVNDLHDAMKQGKGREVEGRILNGLVQYTLQHVAHEEKLMAATAYPRRGEHVRQHQELVAVASRYKAQYDQGRPPASAELMQTLITWLKQHITVSDHALGDWLVAHHIAA